MSSVFICDTIWQWRRGGLKGKVGFFWSLENWVLSKHAFMFVYITFKHNETYGGSIIFVKGWSYAKLAVVWPLRSWEPYGKSFLAIHVSAKTKSVCFGLDNILFHMSYFIIWLNPSRAYWIWLSLIFFIGFLWQLIFLLLSSKSPPSPFYLSSSVRILLQYAFACHFHFHSKRTPEGCSL